MEIELTAGHPSLDLANHAERLRIAEPADAYRMLLELALATGDMDERTARRLSRLASRQPDALSALYRRTCGLAKALRTLLHAEVDGQAPPRQALEVVDREAVGARAHARLLRDTDQGYRWAWDDREGPSLARALWPVARDAAELLVSERHHRIGRCDADECRWLYLDTTRNHSRRWCDMATCGNRTKVRRFRERAAPDA